MGEVVAPPGTVNAIDLADGRTMIVRAATAADADAICALYRDLPRADRRRRFFGTFAPQRGVVLIDLDRDQIVQALMNLVRNAVAALEGLGKIRLRSRAVTNFTIGDTRHKVIASIEIEDDGPGIPSEHLPHLTERFYRVDPGRSREQGGTGLGLAIVKHVLDRHNARLHIQSVPGEGSLFRCDFEQFEQESKDKAA